MIENDHKRDGGGRFAEHLHAEPADVRLSGTDEVYRAGADAYILEKVTYAAAVEMGSMQRHADKRHVNIAWPTTSPLTEAVAGLEAMNAEDKIALLDRARLGHLGHLVTGDPDPRSKGISVAEGAFDGLSASEVGQSLHAAHSLSESGIRGDITLQRFSSRAAEFDVEDDGRTHSVRVLEGGLSFSTEPGEGVSDDWANRAALGVYGDKKTDPAELKRHFEEHRRNAVKFETMSRSKFGDHPDLFGEIDQDRREVELFVDGEEYALSTDDSSITVGGTKVHAAMAAGLLDHVAAFSTKTSGPVFVKDLGETLREVRRNLV